MQPWVRRGLLLAVGGLLAAGVVLGLQARQAEQHLTAARDRLPSLVSALVDGEPAEVRGSLAALQGDTAAARRATDGPLWALAAALPWAGDTPGAVRALTATVDDLTWQVLPDLADTAELLAPSRLLAAPDRLDLAALAAARPPLDRAAARLDALSADLHAPGLVPAVVGAAHDELDTDLARLRAAVRTAADATRLLPAALGADGPRRYFVGFQTNAESRGTGGLVGAYGILLADRGRLSMPVLGDDTDLEPLRSTVDLGADYTALYGRDPELWGNTNLSPHFPYAARRWIEVWERRTGQRLDGALATDPVGLAHLLRAQGPVRLGDGEQVSADDVVRLTLWDVYARFDGQERARKAFLVDVAGAVVDHLLDDGAGELRPLVTALRELVQDGRLAVYSARPEEQRALSGRPLSGEVPQDRTPYAAVVVNNAAGNKLDYHLRREVDYELDRCRDGLRDTVVRVRLTNAVPPGPLPAYASGREDLPEGASFARGSHKVHLSVYATTGAGLRSAELDGAVQPVRTGLERGHPVFVVPVELAPGQSRTVVLRLVEPARAGAVRVPEQPLVQPQTTRVRDAGCPLGEQDVSSAARPAS